MFRLSSKSESKLLGVHPSLYNIVHRAIEISKVDFMVGEGVRTIETQKAYIRTGASKTMRSRHIKEMNKNGYGCAVDLWALNDLDGDGDLDVNWIMKHYYPIAEAMKQAAKDLGIPVEWGFDLWKWDGPHFQLPWKDYP